MPVCEERPAGASAPVMYVGEYNPAAIDITKLNSYAY
jgi:hypothetical protein